MVHQVVFLDLDGTLVGDVKYVLCMWEFANKLGRGRSMNAVKADIAKILKLGLLRPNLTEFVTQASPRCQFFIYTASERKWAECLVSCIEKVINFKFHRPLFCRENCLIELGEKGSIKKSLNHVMPRALKTLSNKNIHNICRLPVIIDNAKVIVSGEMRSWIPVPTYRHIQIVDVLRHVDVSVLYECESKVHKILKHYEIVSSRQHPHGVTTNTLANYYNELAKAIASTRQSNTHDDNTFIRLLGMVALEGIPFPQKRITL